MNFFVDRVIYSDLNDKQKENFNFQKVSSVLVDHGFMTIRLSSDWQSADFIAQHTDGVTFLKVQLKGRFTINRDFFGKDLYICFPNRAWDKDRDWDRDRRGWYLCPHDMLMEKALEVTTIGTTVAWQLNVHYHSAKPPKSILSFLEEFALRTSS